jgi:23S rRNA (guanosine2251-2'-O)-methyltransferase
MSSDDDRPKTPKDSHYARLRRTHRDAKAGGPGAGRGETSERPNVKPRPTQGGRPLPKTPEGLVRLYGLHTVEAALANKRRRIERMMITRNAMLRLEIADLAALPFPAELVEPRAIDALVGVDAVHQGVLLEAQPMATKPLSALTDTPLVLVLDQVTDPHNVGAVMRSAVAFGAGALIVTVRHSPSESGVLAKAASGALEHIDLIAVRNLSEALGELYKAGFQTIGLDSDGPTELETSFSGGRIALVLGAEGKGLRQKTRETVSTLARLDMPGAIRSLNVSNAAAVALYAARRHIGI